MPVSARICLDEAEDLRLDGDVEGGGRLVGEEDGGPPRRARWRSSRAGTSRPRARTDTAGVAGRVRRCRRRPAWQRAWRRASSWRSGRCARSASTSWSPTVMTGSSELVGSWKTIETRPPRTPRISASESARRSVPSSTTRPPTERATGGSSRMIASAVIDFPQPLSPTSAWISPAARSNVTPSTTRVAPMATSRPLDCEDGARATDGGSARRAGRGLRSARRSHRPWGRRCRGSCRRPRRAWRP